MSAARIVRQRSSGSPVRSLRLAAIAASCRAWTGRGSFRERRRLTAMSATEPVGVRAEGAGAGARGDGGGGDGGGVGVGGGGGGGGGVGCACACGCGCACGV